jgi:hypothetical protein
MFEKNKKYKHCGWFKFETDILYLLVQRLLGRVRHMDIQTIRL